MSQEKITADRLAAYSDAVALYSVHQSSQYRKFLCAVDRVEKGAYRAKPAAVFSFEQIREAQRLMESNQATGKIVVKL